MDQMIKTGDMVKFGDKASKIGAAIVTIPPVPISGTGKHSLKMFPGCVEGDEKKVVGSGAYMTATHSIPGSGMAFIDKLGDDQVSKVTTSGNKGVILKGSTFKAKFTVMIPAMQPSSPSPIPDTTPIYQGEGEFIITADPGVEDAK